MVAGRARTRSRTGLVVVVLLALVLVGSGLALLPSARASPTYPPLTGSVSGPSTLGLNSAHYYILHATGGPAFALNGTQIGNLTFRASLAAINTTAVSLTPTFGAIVNGSYQVSLSVGNVSEAVTIQVEYSSVYQQLNVSLNVTYVVQVVQPYILSGLIQAGSESVLPFQIQVSLDGTPVGMISIPRLSPNQEYNFTYNYLTSGLSSGSHTFTLTLPTQHGQVHFAGGALSYQFTFYVPGPAPDYTLYYALGVAAFIGVILIFLILVGARRRGGSRS